MNKQLEESHDRWDGLLQEARELCPDGWLRPQNVDGFRRILDKLEKELEIRNGISK